jgi:hypothetical protein
MGKSFNLDDGMSDFLKDYKGKKAPERGADVSTSTEDADADYIIITKKKPKTKKLLITLRQSLYDELRGWCGDNGVTVTDAIREAVAGYLDEKKKEEVE